MRVRFCLFLGWMCAALALWSCSDGNGTDLETDLQELEARREGVLTLVHDSGCGNINECQHIAFGVKACGGPKRYVIYCTRTTDEKALMDAVFSFNQFEAAFNREHGVESDCSVTPVPTLGLTAGQCVATPPAPLILAPPPTLPPITGAPVIVVP